MLLPLQQLLKIFYFSLLFFVIPFQVCGPAYSYPHGWDFQAAFERYPPFLRMRRLATGTLSGVLAGGLANSPGVLLNLRGTRSGHYMASRNVHGYGGSFRGKVCAGLR